MVFQQHTLTIHALRQIPIKLHYFSIRIEGFVAGSLKNNQGAAVNYQCMPTDPQFGYIVSGYQNNEGILVGAEYSTGHVHDDRKHVNNYNVPCAVCHVTERSAVYSMPGCAFFHFSYIAKQIHILLRQLFSREKGRDLTQPMTKTLTPTENSKTKSDNIKRHQKFTLHNDCGPT